MILEKLQDRLYSNAAPFDRDAPVTKAIDRLEYADLSALLDDGVATRTTRAHLRYLAALFPDHNLVALAREIHMIVGNKNLTQDDIRLILDGRSVADPSRRTREIPIDKVQRLGRLLSQGVPVVDAARQVDVARNTARAIDDYLGLTQVYADKQLDTAIDLAREGASSRTIAEALRVSAATGYKLQQRALGILRELGEVK
jgi:hypothetical protein